MINITLPSLNPKKTYTYVAPVRPPAPPEVSMTEIFQEASRRDAIVKKEAADCPYFAGDWALPATEEGRAKYGQCYVEGICESYADMGNSKDWPKTDRPLIVTAFSEKLNNRFFCTWDYLVKHEKS